MDVVRPYWPVQLLLAFGLTLAVVASVLLALSVPLLGWLVVSLVLVGAAVLWRRASRQVVMSPNWSVRGVAIDGDGFALLEDIDGRFAYAERQIGLIPTGIDWDDVDADVRALLWEAAEHAAAMTALDGEIHELRYAEPGTAQGALKQTLEERREERVAMLLGIQHEAEDLARVAGNAAAAARVALAASGSLAALEVVAPTARGVLARDVLADAKARLAMLADVWSSLDESTTLLGEQMTAEAEQREDT